ncbi:hypothetical protein L4C34_15770 [Vibrio profundum]|uniref:hypothetical protein n=1 Tax=Vibrio profundum TaxID=2910247 RepID=UPI003D0A55DC
MRVIFLSVLFTSVCYAQSLTIADIHLYAREGLARICVDSRHISGAELRDMKLRYTSIHRLRKSRLPPDKDFSYYAAQQFWGIDISNTPEYEECVSMLK